ncbi:MAG: hypothetical protein IPL96_12965 [Holophagaceae bacterium]|nr:hypothetical protein [Holophagaceae bacterium]
MDIPNHLRHMVDELGEALVSALINDPRCRDLALDLQREGFELTLSLEATPFNPDDQEPASRESWSEDDKAFLKTFRIALE